MTPTNSTRLPWLDPQPGDVFTAKHDYDGDTRVFTIHTVSEREVDFTEEAPSVPDWNGSMRGALRRDVYLDWDGYSNFSVVSLACAHDADREEDRRPQGANRGP